MTHLADAKVPPPPPPEPDPLLDDPELRMEALLLELTDSMPTMSEKLIAVVVWIGPEPEAELETLFAGSPSASSLSTLICDEGLLQ